jgi:phosphate transport system substrate-binding protein
MKGIYFFACCFILLSCANETDKANIQSDTPKKGTIYISVDETFKPVMEEQIKVYRSSFPEANIIASYKPEVDCFRDLLKDSTRMIIVARGLTKDETAFFENKLSYQAQVALVAYDAVAVIVNTQSKDSIFTIADLKNVLTGKKNTTAIMDGKNATSSVRYLQDSVLRGASFGPNVVAVNGSEAVVEAIKSNENAIGFVGLSWVGNVDEPKQKKDLTKLRLALVECVKCTEKDMFAKPSQATITFGQYPLARPLYYIVKENAPGLGTGFVNFMSLERGQLIFRRSGLAPAKMSFLKRNSKIKEQE